MSLSGEVRTWKVGCEILQASKNWKAGPGSALYKQPKEKGNHQ